MGCQYSQLRLLGRKKWLTPIQPFDPKRVPEELKRAKKANRKPLFKKTYLTRKSKSESTDTCKEKCRFDWWMSKSHRIKVMQITVKPYIAPPPTNATSNHPRVTTIRPKAARPQRPYPIRDFPLPDIEERRTIPWVKPESGIQVNLPPVPTGPSSIDEEFEALFTYPDPVLQDVEEPTIHYGQYSNRCPTRGGIAFDLIFDDGVHLTSVKPALRNPGRPRQARYLLTKAELNRKQNAAAKRREENKQHRIKRMKEQAALDKFMQSQLTKQAKRYISDKKSEEKNEEWLNFNTGEEIKDEVSPAIEMTRKTKRIIIRSIKRMNIDCSDDYY